MKINDNFRPNFYQYSCVFLLLELLFWEKHKDDKYGYNGFNLDENISLYGLVLDQYKNILTSNIKYMMQQAKAELHLYAQAGYLN